MSLPTRSRRWREVTAAAAAAFVVALAYVAGRVDSGPPPASAAATAQPTATPAQQERLATQSEEAPSDGAGIQTPSSQLAGGPPVTEAS